MWHLAGSTWQVALGRWHLAGGSWQVAVGRWQLAGVGAVRKAGIMCPHQLVVGEKNVT